VPGSAAENEMKIIDMFLLHMMKERERVLFSTIQQNIRGIT